MALTYQDVLWVQGANTSPTLDMSQAGVSVPRRCSDFHGYSWHCFWTGSPKGTLTVQVSNASVLGDQLVQPAQWVLLPVTISIGQGTTPASSPSLLEVTFGRAGWTSLIWTPSGSAAGQLQSKFDGVRR